MILYRMDVTIEEFINDRSMDMIMHYVMLLQETEFEKSGSLRLSKKLTEQFGIKDNGVAYNMYLKLLGGPLTYRSICVSFVESYVKANVKNKK